MSTASSASVVDALRASRLLEAGQLQELNVLHTRFPDPVSLVGELVRRGWLTPYQANELAAGRGDGLLLGSYALLERLGEGGMGQVFKARNWKLGRIVALKVIRKERLTSEDAVRRFHREIQATAALSHPNIVLAYDADAVQGTHFFVMEYAEGQDLAHYVARHGPLPVGLACECVRQAALGLQHAFEKGMVHRDVKPHNLLLTRRPGPDGKPVVKLLDMGLALLSSSGEGDTESLVTQENVVVGTPDFMAPEQAMGARNADVRSDLYALGCTFYFLLTGRVPFPGDTMMAKLIRHKLDEPEPVEKLRPDVPPLLAAVVRKLMAKLPEDRFQTPAELIAALAGAGSESGPMPAAPPAPAAPPSDHSGTQTLTGLGDTADVPPPRRRARRRAGPWVAGGFVVLLLAGASALVVHHFWARSEEGPPEQARDPQPAPVEPPPRKPSWPADLVARFNPERDTVSGQSRKVSWQGAVEIEVVPEGALEFAQAMPEEYELTAKVRHLRGREGLSLVLPIGDQRTRLVIDGYGGGLSGLKIIDGVTLDKRPGAHRGRLLQTGKESTLVVRVGKRQVEAWCGDKKVVDWKGDPKSLSTDLPLLGEDPGRLQVRLWDSSVAIDSLELALKQPPDKIDLLQGIDPRRRALLGTWRLEGGTLVGSSEHQTVLRLPGTPPPEYRLTVRAEWRSGSPKWMAVLSAGERRFLAVIDHQAWKDGVEVRTSGLSLVDRKAHGENPTRYAKSVMPYRKIAMLTFEVRGSEVRAACDGRAVFRYLGAPDVLSLPAEWASLPTDLKLGVILAGNHYRIHEVKPEPLETDR